uniref:UDP-N-acetylglucosamine--N-acetylmuramyl- (pentapeptide) pyrophosphoryl-undecaprenol N-acetylglucosamine transferase n=1 Tax=Wolbachia endosymbiont of Pentidionis agamae TaxID=3110435 RepID=UPI002FD446FC
MSSVEIVLATGGTGGHVFPAINLANKLKDYNCMMFFDKRFKINSKRDIKLESYILPLCGFSGNIFHKFKFCMLLAYSCLLAIYKIKKVKPKLVIGFGSYASFPTLLAARIFSIPIVLHEQNIVLGMVNRLFSNYAQFISTSFPGTKYVKEEKCVLTGNFTNENIYNTHNTFNGIYNILIIGGSQGSGSLDNIVVDAICNLPINVKRKIKIVQQCLKDNISKIKILYENNNIDH